MVLDALEKGEREGSSHKALIDDLPLFAVAPPPVAAAPSGPSPLQERLEEVHPDSLSPREALNLIYELKDLADSKWLSDRESK